MLWRVHHQTVNLVPPGKHSRFESVDTHQISPGDGIGIRVGLRSQILGVRLSSGAPILRSQSVHGRTYACHA